jgi:hypothetical protein
MKDEGATDRTRKNHGFISVFNPRSIGGWVPFGRFPPRESPLAHNASERWVPGCVLVVPRSLEKEEIHMK